MAILEILDVQTQRSEGNNTKTVVAVSDSLTDDLPEAGKRITTFGGVQFTGAQVYIVQTANSQVERRCNPNTGGCPK